MTCFSTVDKEGRMYYLTDAEVMKEFLDEGGVPDAYAMDRLGVLTLVYSREGDACFPIRCIVFEDGSVLTF